MDRTLGQLSQMLGLLSAAAFVLSVLYNWGYFIAIDISFLSLLTLQDYFLGAIASLPPLIVSGGISAGLMFYWRGPGYSAKRSTEIAAAVQAGREPRGVNLKRTAFWSLIIGGVLAPLAFLFVPSNFPIGFLLPAMFIYLGAFADLVVQTPDATLFALFRNRPKLFVVGVAFAFPVIGLFVFLNGMTDAYSEARRKPSVELKHDADAQSEDVVFVRKLGGGVIYRLPNTNEVVFETVDPQLTFTVKARPMSPNSWSCHNFGWPCFFPMPSSSK